MSTKSFPERVRSYLVEDLDHLEASGARVEELVGGVDDAKKTSRRGRSYRKLDAMFLAPMRVAWDDWRTKFGGFMVLFFVFMAYVWEPMYPRAWRYGAPTSVQPFKSQYKQFIFDVQQFSIGPWTYTGVWQYPLGTNTHGQGILQRIVNAAPDMAELVLAGAVVSVGIAVIIGTLSGYKGGGVDDVLMVLTDIVLTIPGLPLTLMLAAVFQPKEPFILGLILAIDSWPGLARSVRSQVLTTRRQSFVEASHAMGVPLRGILAKDIIPPLLPYIFINAARAGKGVINQAVALYFLNFLQNSAPNWGRMMDRAYQNGAITNADKFYQIFWPMLVLAALSFSLVLLAQGLDKIANPRLRARHAKTIDDDELVGQQPGAAPPERRQVDDRDDPAEENAQ